MPFSPLFLGRVLLQETTEKQGTLILTSLLEDLEHDKTIISELASNH